MAWMEVDGRSGARKVLGTLALLLAASGAALAPGASAQSAAAPRAGQPVILVTGSTDGLGREVALRSAATGAHVIVHGRNRERGMAVVAEIEKAGVGSARFYSADFGSLAEVRALGEAILRDYDRLDVLVNNAGIWLSTPEREVSEDGHELHFAVNYLSGFLLTRQLLPLLRESAPSRIVNVASAAQRPIDFTDVMIERDYSASRGYGQSKLSQILFTVDLAEELRGTGVDAFVLHPASMMGTTLVTSLGMPVRSTIAEGAEAVMNLVTSRGLESGQYYNGLRPMQANDQAYDAAARERLRTLSRSLTGAP